MASGGKRVFIVKLIKKKKITQHCCNTLPDQYFILRRNIRKSPEQGKGARLTHIIPLELSRALRLLSI